MKGGERELLEQLTDQCALAARQGLTAARDAMRSPRRRNAHAYVREMLAISEDLTRHLETAEAARRDGRLELAEEGYHRAVNLMVELRCRAGSSARLSAAGMA
ncbi:MAG: hypothetical protein AAF441_15160 [Pseudomonadota bacterium]